MTGLKACLLEVACTVLVIVWVASPSRAQQTLIPAERTTSVAALTVPTLTTDQQKDLTIAFQAVELWQLRATNAVTEFEKAKTAAQDLVRTSTPAGYQITQPTAGKFELVKLPELKTAPTSP